MQTQSFIFTLTSELKETLTLLCKIAGQNTNDSGYPKAVLVDGTSLAAGNKTVIIKYVMGQDETGLVPQIFDSPVLIPINGIMLMAESSAGTEITVSLEQKMLQIRKGKGKKGKVSIAAMSAEDFPSFGEFQFSGIDKISVGDFIESFNSCKYSISDNIAKPIYTGLNISISDGNIVFSSVDGISASRCTISYKSEERFSISVPKPCLEAVMMAIARKDSSENVSIARAKGGRHVAFVIGSHLVIRTMLLDGEPLDTSFYFKEQPNSCMVSKSELVSILKSIQTISGNDKITVPILFKFADKELEVSYNGTTAKLIDSVSAESEKDLAQITIGLNPEVVYKTLKSIPVTEKVKISYAGSTSPVLFEDDRGKGNKHIVVPVRIANE